MAWDKIEINSLTSGVKCVLEEQEDAYMAICYKESSLSIHDNEQDAVLSCEMVFGKYILGVYIA